MYEISLVPDVKAELINRLKLRNFVVFVCIIVSLVCGGVVLALVGVTSGQGIVLANQDTELQCRSEGANAKTRCNGYGTAIKKFKNAAELLTIQDQMQNLASLNENKIKFSRVFDIMSTILPSYSHNDDNDVKVSEISASIENDTLLFDAIGRSKNQIGYRSLEAFRKGVERTYYDYGAYMRLDPDTHEYVEIPGYCIDDMIDEATNIAYGIYHKGNPGCEAPMFEKKENPSEENTDEDEEEEGGSSLLQGSLQQGITTEGLDIEKDEAKAQTQATETAVVEKKDIKIRRTYANSSDREEYKKGNDRYSISGGEAVSGYYFESACLQYDDDGNFSEVDTISTCPLLSDVVSVGDSSFGRDSNDELVLSFSVSLPISHDIYVAKNRHMMIVGPNRQNVTDSYIQIHDMFEAAVKDVDENDNKELTK